MPIHEREISAAETAIASEPLPRAQVPAARGLGLAKTTAAQRDGSDNDSLVSGATLHSEEAPSGTNHKLPHKIGRFLVLGKLGSGGMGLVVEAYDPELDRKVAIKILRTHRGRSQSQARLLREAQAMARVSHANVVHVYDVGMLGEQVFLAMELVVGQTLAQWLEAQPRPWQEVLARFIEAGRGLAAAHRAGVVHRDFKPDNVLIGEDGRVCVADFGLAREDLAIAQEMLVTRDDNPGARPLLANTLTTTGVVMGTPMYMSPEQHLGEKTGIKSDIFSFSVALFEGLYGIRPFHADTMANLTHRVLNGEITKPPGDRSVPSWLDAVVRRGLMVAPDERWPNFDCYLEALAADARRRRRQYLGAGALALCATVFGGVLQAQSSPEVCTAGAQTIAAVWGPKARADVHKQLATLPESTRQTIEPRVIEGLDAYAIKWEEQERAACLGHHHGERTDKLFDAQGQCMDLRRRALARAVTRISQGDDATLREATMIVAKLPPIASCDDRSALLADVPPPSDPDLAAVAGIRGRLVELDVDASAGDLLHVLDELHALRGEAVELEYRPLLAEIDLHTGRLALEAKIWDRSLPALARAFIDATATGMDDVAAEAKARYLFVAGMNNPEDALAEVAHAEALVTRLEGREDLQALLQNNLGAVMAMGGDRFGARVRVQKALDLATGNPGVRPIDLASGYILNLAMLSDDPDERIRLYQQALTILDGVLGPQHPVAMTSRQRAGMLAGDPQQAEAFFSPTCPRLLKSSSTAYENCFECYHRLGHVLIELGRSEDAAAVSEAGLACFDHPIAEQDRQKVEGYREILRGRTHLYAGEYSESERPLAEARKIFEPYRERWWIALLLADIDLADGRRLLAIGDAQAAIQPLEAAVEAFDPLRQQAFDDLPKYGLARAQVALAEALIAAEAQRAAVARRDGGSASVVHALRLQASPVKERARALVSEAEAYYRTESSYTARLETLLRWRDKHLSQP